MGPEERAIREVHSTWIGAVNAGDLARLLRMMADDVVFLNPGQAPVGRLAAGVICGSPPTWWAWSATPGKRPPAVVALVLLK